MSIQAKQKYSSSIVSSHKHLPTNRHVHTAVPVTGRETFEALKLYMQIYIEIISNLYPIMAVKGMGFNKWKTVIKSLKKSRNLLKDKCGKQSQERQINQSILHAERQLFLQNSNTDHKHEIYKHHQKSIFSISQEITQGLSSPKFMVVMATIWGSRQYLTLEALKTLQADRAITRSNKDFGHICGAELHPPYKITSSLLRGQNRQTQAC